MISGKGMPPRPAHLGAYEPNNKAFPDIAETMEETEKGPRLTPPAPANTALRRMRRGEARTTRLSLTRRNFQPPPPALSMSP